MANPNTVPIYPGAASSGVVRNAVANTARDGSGTLSAAIVTAGAQGCIVYRWGAISSAAIGASTPMVVRLWRVNGATITLLEEGALVTATTSNTVIGTRFTGLRTNIILAATEIIKVTNSIAEAVDFEVEFGQF